MKRNLLLSTLLLASASMAAQGFDGSFDETWETCYPDGKTAVGTQPKGWMHPACAKTLLSRLQKNLWLRIPTVWRKSTAIPLRCGTIM